MLVPGDSICQVSEGMSTVKCHISGVRYHVSSDNMSSTSVIYQVSSITCQVPVSDIKCQVNITPLTIILNSLNGISNFDLLS